MQSAAFEIYLLSSMRVRRRPTALKAQVVRLPDIDTSSIVDRSIVYVRSSVDGVACVTDRGHAMLLARCVSDSDGGECEGGCGKQGWEGDFVRVSLGLIAIVGVYAREWLLLDAII